MTYFVNLLNLSDGDGPNKGIGFPRVSRRLRSLLSDYLNMRLKGVDYHTLFPYYEYIYTQTSW